MTCILLDTPHRCAKNSNQYNCANQTMFKPVIFKRVLLLDDTLFLSSLNLYTSCEDSIKDKNRTAKTKQ